MNPMIKDARTIIDSAIQASLPDEAVKKQFLVKTLYLTEK